MYERPLQCASCHKWPTCVVVEHCGDVFGGELVDAVAHEHTRLTDASVPDRHTLHVLQMPHPAQCTSNVTNR